MERALRPDRETSQLLRLARPLRQRLTEFRRSASMCRVVIATLVLLLVSSAAFAQEMRTEHKVGLSLYVGAATLDYHSTYQSMKVGIPESNPLGRFTGETGRDGVGWREHRCRGDAAPVPVAREGTPAAHHRAALLRRGVSDPPGDW